MAEKLSLREVLACAQRIRDADDARQAAIKKMTDPLQIADAMKGVYK